MKSNAKVAVAGVQLRAQGLLSIHKAHGIKLSKTQWPNTAQEIGTRNAPRAFRSWTSQRVESTRILIWPANKSTQLTIPFVQNALNPNMQLEPLQSQVAENLSLGKGIH